MLNDLSAEYVRNALNYDPDTGAFTWANPSSNRVAVGSIAGCVNKIGYRVIRLNDRLYLGHRLACLYVDGVWPTGHVDHANLIRSDNRWENIRPATPSQNHANTPIRSDNKSGFKGVIWNKCLCKWQAYITVDKCRTHLGYFNNLDSAKEAYRAAAHKHFGEFARVA